MWMQNYVKQRIISLLSKVWSISRLLVKPFVVSDFCKKPIWLKAKLSCKPKLSDVDYDLFFSSLKWRIGRHYLLIGPLNTPINLNNIFLPPKTILHPRINFCRSVSSLITTSERFTKWRNNTQEGPYLSNF